MSTLSAVPGFSHDARAHEATKSAPQMPRRVRSNIVSSSEQGEQEKKEKDNESFTRRKKKEEKTEREKKRGKVVHAPKRARMHVDGERRDMERGEKKG